MILLMHYNIYTVTFKNGDKMLSFINKYHPQAIIHCDKQKQVITFTTISQLNQDIYIMLPDANIKNKIKLNLNLQQIINNINTTTSDLDIDVSFEDLYHITEYMNYKKRLIIDLICIIIGRIKDNTYEIIALMPKKIYFMLIGFHILDGFYLSDDSTNIVLSYLNLLHNQWKYSKMKSDIFIDEYIDSTNILSCRINKKFIYT